MKGYNWLNDSPEDGIKFNLGHYHSFASMVNYLNSLAINHREIVQVMSIGTTHEGRQIPLIKVTFIPCLFLTILNIGVFDFYRL